MTAANPPLQSAAPYKGLLARHPLVFFFIIAYAFTWIAWSPWVLSEDGLGLLPYQLGDTASGLLNAAAIFLGPTVSAFIMTGVTEGRAGIRRLLRRIVLWRVGFRWYLFAFIGVPLVMALGTIIVPGALASFQFLGLGYVLTYLALFIPITIQGGPLFEEIGWRGFALPRMQPLHGPLGGSIILGLLWGLWHLPEFMVPDWAATSGGSDPLALVKFGMFAIAVAIVLTWVFNNTKGSVLMAILVHASIDVPFLPFSPVGLLVSPSEAMNSMLLSLGVLALLVVTFTRGRLGYQHYRQEVEPDPATAST
jgi:membrane protease YdiL (CAAX protease family)